MAFDETQHPREDTGRFTGKPQSAPELTLADGEQLVWLIEGDDHEYERVEAATEDEALDLAADLFTERYSDEDRDDEYEPTPVRDLLRVKGVFRSDADADADELEFLPYPGTSERSAIAALDYV